MGERTSHPPGTLSWSDLATSDTEAAKRFYTGLFGWEPDDRPIPEEAGGGTYTMLLKDGKEAAALSSAQGGMPPHWTSYVTVESAGDSAAKAKELGAIVMMEPFDVLDAGRMAVIQDPTGAVFCVWEPRASIGATVVNVPGALTLNQLNTGEPEKALEFYGDLLGWRSERVNGSDTPYWGIYLGDRLNGGAMQMPPDQGAPPHWLSYFGSESVESDCERASELGGRLLVAPMEVPGGKIAVVQDPQGAVFGLFAGRFDD